MLVLFFASASFIAVAPVFSSAETVNGSWASKAPMQVARSGLGVAVANGKIYAIGGDARGGKSPYVGSIVGTNAEYDSETDTWAFKESMPTPRCDFAIATYQNKIYCIGGIVGIDDVGRHITGVNEVYDPETDTWETKMSMPTARWALQANVLNGKIYLIGGYVPDDSDFGGSISVLNEVYDPETDSWTTKASMPVATAEYPSAVVDSKIYVISGLPSSSNLNQIYDAETDTWSQGALSPSSVRSGAAGATVGVNALKRVYVLGVTWDLWEGEPSYTVRVYDPASDRWTYGANVPTNRLNFRVAMVNDVLYAIGGYTRTYPDRYRVGDFITLYATNEQYTPFGYGTPDPSYDGTAPEIAVTSPQNKTYYTADVALNFTINETVSSLSYTLDGEASVEISGNTTLTGLSYGAHNITVYAVDASGNTGTSKTVFFTIAEPEPFPTTVVATASGASLTIISIGLLIYFKKRKN